MSALEQINDQTKLNRDLYLLVLISLIIAFFANILRLWNSSSIYFWICISMIIVLILYIVIRVLDYQITLMRDVRLGKKIDRNNPNVKYTSNFRYVYDELVQWLKDN